MENTVLSLEKLRSSFSGKCENLDLGLEEARLWLEVSRAFREFESEKTRLKLQIDRLERNNAWLTQELCDAQHKLQISEQNVAQLEEEKRHLEFIVSIQNLEPDDEEVESEFFEEFELSVEENFADFASSSSFVSTEFETSSESDFDSGMDNDSGTFSCSTPTRYAKNPKVFRLRRDSGIAGRGVDADAKGKRARDRLPRRTAYKRRANPDVDQLARLLIVGGEICPRVRALRRHVLNYVYDGRPDRAALLCQLTLGKVEGTIGRDNAFYVSVLIIMAMINKFQGKLEDAVSRLMEALTLRQDMLGSHHLSVVDLHNYLSLCFIEMNNFAEAERHLGLALEIKRLHFGEDHVDVARQIKNLALLCRHQHRYEEAAELYERAAKIYENKYGSKDPVTTRAVDNSMMCSTKHKRWSIATY